MPRSIKQVARLLAAQIKATVPPPVLQQLVSNPALVRQLLDELSAFVGSAVRSDAMNDKQKLEVARALIKAGRKDLAAVLAAPGDAQEFGQGYGNLQAGYATLKKLAGRLKPPDYEAKDVQRLQQLLKDLDKIIKGSLPVVRGNLF